MMLIFILIFCGIVNKYQNENIRSAIKQNGYRLDFHSGWSLGLNAAQKDELIDSVTAIALHGIVRL